MSARVDLAGKSFEDQRVLFYRNTRQRNPSHFHRTNHFVEDQNDYRKLTTGRFWQSPGLLSWRWNLSWILLILAIITLFMGAIFY